MDDVTTYCIKLNGVSVVECFPSTRSLRTSFRACRTVCFLLNNVLPHIHAAQTYLQRWLDPPSPPQIQNIHSFWIPGLFNVWFARFVQVAQNKLFATTFYPDIPRGSGTATTSKGIQIVPSFPWYNVLPTRSATRHRHHHHHHNSRTPSCVGPRFHWFTSIF